MGQGIDGAGEPRAGHGSSRAAFSARAAWSALRSEIEQALYWDCWEDLRACEVELAAAGASLFDVAPTGRDDGSSPGFDVFEVALDDGSANCAAWMTREMLAEGGERCAAARVHLCSRHFIEAFETYDDPQSRAVLREYFGLVFAPLAVDPDGMRLARDLRSKARPRMALFIDAWLAGAESSALGAAAETRGGTARALRL